MVELFTQNDLSLLANKSVLIDAGHGGDDAGAVGYFGSTTTYLEKTLNLRIALYLEQYLKTNFNVTVYMVRTNDKSMSLIERTNLANRLGVDFYFSIHHNAFNKSARGYEDFIYTSLSDASTGGKIRDSIHTEVSNRVLKKYGIPNRGKKKANFHVLRETNMNAMLVETLFVDSAADQKLLASSSFSNEIAVAYGEGIAKGLNLSRKQVVSKPTTQKPSTNTLYRVQVGAFGVRQNAENVEAQLKRAGFPAFVYQD